MPLRAFTTDVGVDVLSFGGTKNGLMLGEVVVVLDPAAAPGVRLRTQVVDAAGVEDALRVRAVRRAAGGPTCGCATPPTRTRWRARLEAAVRGIEGVAVQRPVQANAVFAVLPKPVTARLQKRFRFYTWDEPTGEVRWMTTFDTTEDDVDAFAAAIREEIAAG